MEHLTTPKRKVESHRSNLINHLLDNYERYGGGYIRPVLDSDTVTTVVVRMLFHHLIEMVSG